MKSKHRERFLRHATAMPERWIRREGTKSKGFRYREPNGKLIRDRRRLDRIDALRVPPAWDAVHIAVSSRAAVQAWGMDVKGRKQYRYHPRAMERGQLRKYHRVRTFARALPELRQATYDDFRSRGFTRRRIAAAVLRLIGNTFLRVGGETYARENETFGATTLRKDHVHVKGDQIVLAFRGKSGKDHFLSVSDRQLARLIRSLLRAPGARLFRYRNGDGDWRDLSAAEVNDYIRELTGARYSAKDLRTWGGTLRAATILAELGAPRSATEAKKNVVMAMRLVAAELGNTPAITRSSYVHPIVIARYLDDGETIELPRPDMRERLRRTGSVPEERALISFLDRHFPERRAEGRLADAA